MTINALDRQIIADRFNGQREKLLSVANMDAGNHNAEQRKWEAIGALRLLDILADQLGLSKVTTYHVK